MIVCVSSGVGTGSNRLYVTHGCPSDSCTHPIQCSVDTKGAYAVPLRYPPKGIESGPEGEESKASEKDACEMVERETKIVLSQRPINASPSGQ